MRAWLPTLADRRTVLVSFGVALIFVPTAFGVFVEATEWSAWIRGLVLAGWLLIAAFLVWGSVIHGERVEDIVGAARSRRNASRDLATDRVLSALLQCGTDLPDHYLFRVFIYDEDEDRLVVSYDPEGRRPTTAWAPGRGATGAAWEKKEFVLVEDDSVSDDTYGLTPEQQEKYKDLRVVGAMPVLNESDEMVAVLVGSSKTNDGALATTEGFRKFQELAVVVGRVLIDLQGQEDD